MNFDKKIIVLLLIALVIVMGAAYWAQGWYSLLLYGLLLLGPAIEDGRSGYISDGWSVLLAAAGLVISWHQGYGIESLGTAGMMVVLYGLMYIWKREAAGMGDVLLSIAAALWLTPIFGLLFLWMAAVSALAFYGLCVLFRRPPAEAGLRFAPFLAFGGVMAYGMQEMWGISLLYTFRVYPI